MTYGLPDHGDLDWDDDVDNSVEALYTLAQAAAADAAAARNYAEYSKNIIDETGLPDITAAVETTEAAAAAAEASATTATGAASTASGQATASSAARVSAEAARDAAIAARNTAQAVPVTTDGLMTAIDANASSAYRAQADARLLTSYAPIFAALGSTTSAIQAAVDAADAAFSAGFISGATIRIPAGTYTGGPVVLPQTSVPLHFLGDGMDKSILKKVSSAGTIPSPTHGIMRAVGTVKAGPLRFEDFSIEGVASQGLLHNVNDKAIHIPALSGSNSSGDSNPSVHIIRVKATKHLGESFYTAASLNVYMNNEVSDCSFNALNPVGGSPLDVDALAYVAGNKIHHIGNNTGSGAGIETVTASVVIVNNSFSNLYMAVTGRAHHQVLVAGNTVRTWLGYSLGTVTSGTSTAAISIARGNAVWNGPGHFGVHNNIISNYPRGILVQASSPTDVLNAVHISGNTIHTCAREAIWVEPFEGTINDLSITNNLIVDAGQETHNTYAAIRAGYTNSATQGYLNRPVVQGNKVSSTTATKVKYGVRIEAGPSVTTTDATVKHNDLRDCWATAPVSDLGTNTVQLGNLPGGTVPTVMTIGDSYLWVDGTGALRIKTGAPASTTDGSIVGPVVGSSTYVLQAGGDKTLTQSDATNYQDIPGLSVTLVPGTYALSGYVEAVGATAADCRVRFLPGGGLAYSGSWSVNGLIDTATSSAASVRKAAANWNGTLLTGLVGSGAPVTMSPQGLVVVTTGGTLKFQATQGTADASDVILRNSYLCFTKIA